MHQRTMDRRQDKTDQDQIQNMHQRKADKPKEAHKKVPLTTSKNR